MKMSILTKLIISLVLILAVLNLTSQLTANYSPVNESSSIKQSNIRNIPQLNKTLHVSENGHNFAVKNVFTQKWLNFSVHDLTDSNRPISMSFCPGHYCHMLYKAIQGRHVHFAIVESANGSTIRINWNATELELCFNYDDSVANHLIQMFDGPWFLNADGFALYRAKGYLQTLPPVRWYANESDKICLTNVNGSSSWQTSYERATRREIFISTGQNIQALYMEIFWKAFLHEMHIKTYFSVNNLKDQSGKDIYRGPIWTYPNVLNSSSAMQHLSEFVSNITQQHFNPTNASIQLDVNWKNDTRIPKQLSKLPISPIETSESFLVLNNISVRLLMSQNNLDWSMYPDAPVSINPTVWFNATMDKLCQPVDGSCAHGTLDKNSLPRFYQISQRVDSNFESTLQSLIPTVLSLSLSGEQLIVANLVFDLEQKPSAELYIRWIEAVSLMPIMKLSLPPWTYHNQTVNQIVLKFIDFHRKNPISSYPFETIYNPYARPCITHVLSLALPTIRPLWLTFPDDPQAIPITDQFMLGNSTLVAPVLREGQRSHSVYLPKGIWLDQHSNAFEGPSWFTVQVPLDELAYFKLSEPDVAFNSI